MLLSLPRIVCFLHWSCGAVSHSNVGRRFPCYILSRYMQVGGSHISLACWDDTKNRYVWVRHCSPGGFLMLTHRLHCFATGKLPLVQIDSTLVSFSICAFNDDETKNT